MYKVSLLLTTLISTTWFGLSFTRPLSCAADKYADGCSVPPIIPAPFKVEFTHACNMHDICYGCVSCYHILFEFLNNNSNSPGSWRLSKTNWWIIYLISQFISQYEKTILRFEKATSKLLNIGLCEYYFFHFFLLFI